jgi:hypothetical protein
MGAGGGVETVARGRRVRALVATGAGGARLDEGRLPPLARVLGMEFEQLVSI